ncbi:MAG: arsenosugar biosynthesis radical SAM (seleno)protein ArsS [Gammaproteobacteria bacterium]
MHATLPLLKDTDFPSLSRAVLQTVQVNMGYRCNQSCLHCHVNAGPTRTEMMERHTVDDVLDYLQASGAANLDITGGAPELNPHFRHLVEQAAARGVHVIDRCNLTVLGEPGQQDLAPFFAGHGVEVIASLPCYLPQNVDSQRGKGVYQDSIRALRMLNELGYGRADSGLLLNLMYNPLGPDLPPPQAPLEADYKRYLRAEYGVEFNHLFTLVNMPIQRFGSTLVSKGQFHAYMERLRAAYCPDNLQRVMCRTLVSVDWQGYVYDCDFNQMLGMGLALGGRGRVHVRRLMDVDLSGNPVAVADHCYGCTAGQGSSCGGAL